MNTIVFPLKPVFLTTVAFADPWLCIDCREKEVVIVPREFHQVIAFRAHIVGVQVIAKTSKRNYFHFITSSERGGGVTRLPQFYFPFIWPLLNNHTFDDLAVRGNKVVF